MPQPNVITPSEAAKIKGCTRQGIHAALDRGRLTEYRTGHVRLVVLDKTFEAFEVQETGGRAHKGKRAAQDGAQPGAEG